MCGGRVRRKPSGNFFKSVSNEAETAGVLAGFKQRERMARQRCHSPQTSWTPVPRDTALSVLVQVGWRQHSLEADGCSGLTVCRSAGRG